MQEFQSPRPTVSELTARCPEVGEEVIRRYVERFPQHYFETFQEEEIEAHLTALAALSPEDPVRVLIRRTRDSAEVTFLSYDAPGEFSVLAGLLSATGFDIASGDVYTEARTGAFTGAGHRPAPTRRGEALVAGRTTAREAPPVAPQGGAGVGPATEHDRGTAARALSPRRLRSRLPAISWTAFAEPRAPTSKPGRKR